MNKQIIELLKEFDQLVSDITTMEMQVKIGAEDYREADDSDRLDYLRAEWFQLVNTLNELGIDITEE